jgi:hypothetical protein
MAMRPVVPQNLKRRILKDVLRKNETPSAAGKRKTNAPEVARTPPLKSQPPTKVRVPHPSRFCEGWDVSSQSLNTM